MEAVVATHSCTRRRRGRAEPPRSCAGPNCVNSPPRPVASSGEAPGRPPMPPPAQDCNPRTHLVRQLRLGVAGDRRRRRLGCTRSVFNDGLPSMRVLMGVLLAPPGLVAHPGPNTEHWIGPRKAPLLPLVVLPGSPRRGQALNRIIWHMLATGELYTSTSAATTSANETPNTSPNNSSTNWRTSARRSPSKSCHTGRLNPGRLSQHNGYLPVR